MINRHGKHYSYDKDCDCGVAANDPHWHKKQLSILQKLNEVFQDVKHHKSFTRRLENPFKEALKEYTVSVRPTGDSWSPHKIEVWGNGIHYDNSVCLRLYPNEKKTWQEAFVEDMKRQIAYHEGAIKQIEKEDSLFSVLVVENAVARNAIIAARDIVFTAVGHNMTRELVNHFPLLQLSDTNLDD